MRIEEASSRVREEKKSIYLRKAQSEHENILRLEERQKALSRTI
jgi:hypothetical protein